ncbi:MAG: hypothetical protein ABMB14_26710 [Myxococcota bacterium]
MPRTPIPCPDAVPDTPAGAGSGTLARMDDRGFGWDRYVAWLVERSGSLTAVADRLAAARGYDDDVGTVERALRRLRTRAQEPGGKWGERAVRLFGLPDAVDARIRWMGAYHSRFTDLPVPVCEDLIRAWDAPPITDARGARSWLALARVTVAMRRRDLDATVIHLAAVPDTAELAPEVRIEAWLSHAFVASRRDPPAVDGWLERIGELLDAIADPEERANLHARWIDHRGYELNHQRGARGPDPAAAERVYLEIPEVGPPFASARRSNGLAWCRWKLGRVDEALRCAERAADHAGDGGHVRLRAMALAMVARIDPTRTDARDRARAIAASLDDEILKLRFR